MYDEEGACEVCDAPLPVRRRSDMRVCSAKCRMASNRAAEEAPEDGGCQRCGSPVTGKQRKYCGRSCARAADYERAHGPKPDRSPKPCAQCGKTFQPKPDGPVPEYCGASCRAAESNDRAKADGRKDQWRATSQAKYVPIVHQRVCQRPDCDVSFGSKSPNALWCSARCSMRAYNTRREEDGRLDVYRAARRQREADQSDPSEVFSKADVFERDEWQCWLCETTIDPEAAWPDPLSASVDHVEPLSKGGAHTLANVRAAHLRCNLVKGNREALPRAA